MKPHTVNYALIGIGGFGSQHLKAILELEQADKLRLVAVCDPAIHRFPDVQNELLSRKIRIYENSEDMLVEESELTAVTIAAPIPLHYRMAMACLRRDLHIYLEKPVVPLLEQLDELIDADTRNRIAVGFQMVEADWSRTIKQWAVEGALGEIREIRVAACWPRADRYYNRAEWAGQMLMGGEPVFDGPATNALAHLLHSIMYFSSDRLDGFDAPVEVQGEMYRARPINSYDTVCLRGRCKSGVRFHAALTHAGKTAFPFEIHVAGTKGWVKVSQDGRVFESSLGSLRSDAQTGDLLVRTYERFLGGINDPGARPSTLLADTRGYSIATNALLLSSGGVHSIGKPWVFREETGGGYCVRQFPEIIEEFLRSPLLFSESNLPWAVKSSPIATVGFGGAGDCFSVRQHLESTSHNQPSVYGINHVLNPA